MPNIQGWDFWRKTHTKTCEKRLLLVDSNIGNKVGTGHAQSIENDSSNAIKSVFTCEGMSSADVTKVLCWVLIADANPSFQRRKNWQNYENVAALLKIIVTVFSKDFTG